MSKDTVSQGLIATLKKDNSLGIGYMEQKLSGIQGDLNDVEGIEDFINARDRDGRTPLGKAIMCEKLGIATRLLNVHDIDVNAQDRRGHTPIKLACEKGFLKLVAQLAALGADPYHRNRAGRSGLHCAALQGHVRVVKYLVTHFEFDLDIGDVRGDTPLHDACRTGEPEVVALLLEFGADVHATNKAGKTPLHIAAEHNCHECLNSLCDHGAIRDLEKRDNRGLTPLHCASRWNQSEIAQALLDIGANLSARDGLNKTPYDHAPKHDGSIVVDVLTTAFMDKLTGLHGSHCLHFMLSQAAFLQHGMVADIGKLTALQLAELVEQLDPRILRLQDRNGMLPLHMAARDGASRDFLEALMFPNACRIADKNDALPIHAACSSFWLTVKSIRYILDKGGVDTIRKRDKYGKLPIHCLFTERKNHVTLDVVQFLVDKHPESLSVRTVRGNLPLTLACQSGSLGVIFYLLRQNPMSAVRL